jgi:hypothetical protein
MNLQQQDQFCQAMSRLKGNSRSRAASTNARVTQMINGLLVSKPIMKEPEITILNDSWDNDKNRVQSQAASAPGINKLKAIHDFIKSNGRI